METATGTQRSADKLKIFLPDKKQSKFGDDEWRAKQLVALAEVFKELLTPECIVMYLESLSDLSDDQIRRGVGRSIRELEWFPKPSKLRELAGAEGSATSEDAEARAAWDAATQFCSKYVGNDVHGNYGPEHGWYPKTFPKLSPRILDTVRRTGGWRTYKSMADDDYPHQRKRFFEEFVAWTAVEQVAAVKLLTEMPAFHLMAKPMDTPKNEPRPAPMVPQVTIKKVPEPLTDAQLRDQREILHQQRDEILRQQRDKLQK